MHAQLPVDLAESAKPVARGTWRGGRRRFGVVGIALLATVAVWLGIASCARLGNSVPPGATAPQAVAGKAVQYWTITRDQPRPLQIYCLTADLQDRRYEAVALVADDPDGAGPAEAALTKPEELAARGGVIAAVNANAFAALPDASGKRDTNWFTGKPVDICGWALHDQHQASPPQHGYSSFWVDPAGSGHVGKLAAPLPAGQAAAGFGLLLVAGANVCAEDGVRHPRTALGLDAAGRRLWLVVVDGRQPGYSDGMSTCELAALMLELGCHEAINLDGGGSSVMLVAFGKEPLRIVNRPSGGATRPVPVMLGIRARRR